MDNFFEHPQSKAAVDYFYLKTATRNMNLYETSEFINSYVLNLLSRIQRDPLMPSPHFDLDSK